MCDEQLNESVNRESSEAIERESPPHKVGQWNFQAGCRKLSDLVPLTRLLRSLQSP